MVFQVLDTLTPYIFILKFLNLTGNMLKIQRLNDSRGIKHSVQVLIKLLLTALKI